MNLNDLVKSEMSKLPPKITLYGPPGIGKTPFGAQSVSPIFLQTEDGLAKIEVPHLPVAKTLDDFFLYMDMLINEHHEYKTVVVDTLDWLEKLIWDKVCLDKEVKQIEEIGYGKGFSFAMVHWDKVFRGFEKMRYEKNMAIIMLCHSIVNTITPPDNDPYQKYDIKLHKNARAKTIEWSDAVLFANFKTYVNLEKGKKTGRAVDGGRVLYCQPNPAYECKNRYGLPAEIDFSFASFINAMKGTQTNG